MYLPDARLSILPRLRAMTLIEVTLVTSVLMGLISVTFLGTASYKNGVNRAFCVQNVANVQKAMRSYCNLHELESGQPIADLKKRLLTDSDFFPSEPRCPSKGTYLYHKERVPEVGTLFMRCSIPEHAPKDSYSW